MEQNRKHLFDSHHNSKKYKHNIVPDLFNTLFRHDIPNLENYISTVVSSSNNKLFTPLYSNQHPQVYSIRAQYLRWTLLMKFRGPSAASGTVRRCPAADNNTCKYQGLLSPFVGVDFISVVLQKCILKWWPASLYVNL